MTIPLAVWMEGGVFHFSLELLVSGMAPVALEPLHLHMDVFLRKGGVPDDARHAVLMAAEELITNTEKYGGERRSCGGSVSVGRSELVFEYFDNGIPFDPTKGDPFPEPDDLLDRPAGGLGLSLMASCFGKREYRRGDGRNRSRWHLVFAGE